MSQRLVTVRTLDNLLEAETLRSLLESRGLTAFVFHDDAGGFYPNLQRLGVKLVVPDDQADEAQRILEGREEEDEEEDDTY